MNTLKSLLKSAFDSWRRSPAARMVVRASVVAGLGYVLTAVKNGDPLVWSNLLGACLLAGGYAVIGLLTPAEPKVGVKTNVQG